MHFFVTEWLVLEFRKFRPEHCIGVYDILILCSLSGFYSIVSIVEITDWFNRSYNNYKLVTRYLLLFGKLLLLAGIHAFGVFTYKRVSYECAIEYITLANNLWSLATVSYFYITAILTIKFFKFLAYIFSLCCCKIKFGEFEKKYMLLSDVQTRESESESESDTNTNTHYTKLPI
jgi:hypothetical protein